jgi:type II secretory pathway pseudopilin PulG
MNQPARPFGTILCHRVTATVLLPALGKVIQKSSAAQTALSQAAIACALDRYRLATGHFPEALADLAPRFISPLPTDVLTGEPYKYRLTDGARFVLYSVGWDEKDDGGVPGKSLFDDQQGDWVWEYPAR